MGLTPLPPFEQCLKKLHNWLGMASLSSNLPWGEDDADDDDDDGDDDDDTMTNRLEDKNLGDRPQYPVAGRPLEPNFQKNFLFEI